VQVNHGKKAAEPAVLSRLLVLVAKSLWMLFVVATPFVGAWVASSLAAYSNRSVDWAAAMGLLLFPLLPLAWEAYALVARRRRGVTKRFLTFADRLTLRTLAINLVFLAGVIATHPEDAFVALSTRGDWMLQGRHSGRDERVRGVLFAAAGGLEWLYRAVRSNPYREAHGDEKPIPPPQASAETSAVAPPPAPAPNGLADAGAPSKSTEPQPKARPDAPDEARSGQVATSESAAGPSGTRPPSSPHWPLAPTLHPVVAAMPKEAETSIASVARYIADRESDPFERVKALHDWVADRIAYDAAAFLDGHVTSDDADPDIVFQRRLGVCAGYAKLFQALGRAVGIDVAYVPGDVRIPGMKDIKGAAHAWNAVRIQGHEYLVDTTWDAGHLAGREFKKEYVADYLFAPPPVFGLDHLPDDPAWQLRDPPLSTGQFLRQPMLTPGFYRRGLVLLAPLEPQVTVAGALEVELNNPQRLNVEVIPSDGDACPLSTDASGRVRARCRLQGTRVVEVEIFASEPGASDGVMMGVGQIEANNRP
jgi:hypothetical protein